MYFACARLKKLVKLECHIECSIASFGSGKTTDSDHLGGKKGENISKNSQNSQNSPFSIYFGLCIFPISKFAMSQT